jgi:hypothetical protein
MKAIMCAAILLSFGSLSAFSGEIIKRQVQYGKSDKVNTQYVYQSDRKKSDSRKNSRKNSRSYRPIRSDQSFYYYAPIRSTGYCYSRPVRTNQCVVVKRSR